MFEPIIGIEEINIAIREASGEWYGVPILEWSSISMDGAIRIESLVARVAILCLLMGHSATRSTPFKDDPGKICLTPDCVITSGVILSALDSTADPCHDFYRYACGGWLDQAEIPQWSGGTSKSFSMLSLDNLKTIKTILEQTRIGGPHYKALQKAQNYYTACMDTEAIETAGAEPLLMLIKILDGWSLLMEPEELRGDDEHSNFLNTFMAVHETEGSPLFTTRVSVDDKNSSRSILKFSQSGLWLGSRDLYLGEYEELLEAYVEFGVTLAWLLAEDNGTDMFEDDLKARAKQKMQDILDFEKQLAEITIPQSQLRNPWKTYHKMTLKEFSEMIPEFDVFLLLRRLFGKDIPQDEEVLVPTNKAYFPKINELMKKTPPRILHDYTVWQTVASLAGALPERYQNAALEFQYAYTGIKAAAPRWIRCTSSTNNVLAFVTGAEFVKKEKSASVKDEIKVMIEKIRRMFIESLPTVNWMDPATKARAAAKAQAIVDKIVAPLWIYDVDSLNQHYDKLKVNSGSYFKNIFDASSFYKDKNLAKYQQPVDKSEWYMPPAAVNAYYDPSRNEMVFPAGILQTPFFDPAMPPSLNYGSIGWVMGHEITHGFDDFGHNYDAIGNLNDWWKNQSTIAFIEHALCVLEQYDGYKVGDMHVDGLLTLGENIADNGGLRLAFHAYQKYRERHGEPESQLPGLQDMTPEQLFFISAGQSWCLLDTPQQAMLKLLSDGHSPGKYRVIGTLSNMEEFSEAFQCTEGSLMNPPNKCLVW